MDTFVCRTSTLSDLEIVAPTEEEAAMIYAASWLGDHPGAFASVWVGRAGQPWARACVTVAIPGACPFETAQFRSFVEWIMEVTGRSGDLAWNKAMDMVVRTDMGFEVTPGVVPITFSEKETVTGKMETFEWTLAGAGQQKNRATQ